MVISDSNNFIFLRVPKNASTSLAEFFVKHMCDKNDKWTGIGDARLPTNNISNEIISKYRVQYRFIHLTLEEIIENGVITENDLAKQVITVLRNPLERQLSLYFFKNKGNRSPQSFRYIMKDGYYKDDGSNHILQTDYAKYKGKDYATYWLYESIDEKLEEFAASRGLKMPAQLSKHKAGNNTNALIDEYYDAATRKAVLEYFKDDYEMYMRLKDENR